MAEVEKRSREFSFSRKEFDKLRKIANEYTGIVVSDDKYDMYYARLTKRLRALGLASFAAYIQYLQQNQTTEFTPFIDSITTNLTSFYREKHHFDQLKKDIIPALLNSSGFDKKIRVWSAGCSTGEEPYTIAMTLLEVLTSSPGVSARILASDIDTTVLQRAASGVYEIGRTDGLDKDILKRWFLRGKGSKQGYVRVSPMLQKIIEFRQFNLIRDFPIKEKFNIIFCRNVVIYFDRPTKTQLINHFADHLADDGILILGHSESMQGISSRFRSIGKTVYRKLK